MIQETSEVPLVMKFTMPVKCGALFTFIAQPENMSLYKGFFLVPGIKHVVSSDTVRKVGTLDKVSNTDGSSHNARTLVLDFEKRYSLYLDNFQLTGFKSKLATPILAFKEEWIYTAKSDSTDIERSLVIVYKKGFFNSFFVKYFICPQIYISFLKHHKKVRSVFA